jgi:hypothetical protein
MELQISNGLKFRRSKNQLKTQYHGKFESLPGYDRIQKKIKQ